MPRQRYPRSTCCIIGCARWSTLFPGEWLCVDHWRMVPKRARRALRKLWSYPDLHTDKHKRWLEFRLWRMAKRRVTLRSAGL